MIVLGKVPAGTMVTQELIDRMVQERFGKGTDLRDFREWDLEDQRRQVSRDEARRLTHAE